MSIRGDIIDQREDVIAGELVPVSLEKLVLPEGKIELQLEKWKKKGLMLSFAVKRLGGGFYNREPYKDKITAMKEYGRVVDAVKKGDYRLRIADEGGLRLELTR